MCKLYSARFVCCEVLHWNFDNREVRRFQETLVESSATCACERRFLHSIRIPVCLQCYLSYPNSFLQQFCTDVINFYYDASRTYEVESDDDNVDDEDEERLENVDEDDTISRDSIE